MAILGHDLQQPLSVISASASILPLVGDVAVCRGVLESISRNAARMNRMIQEILDFTRVRTLGTLPVDPKPTSLSDACGRAVDDARMAFPGWKIELRSEDVRGEWDPERLQQVLSNLIGNACHYGNPARPVLVCARREPDAAVLEVHNEGAPIPPDLQPVIFEAFRRSPGASRRSGLGLGLYIVSEIVRAHRGSIEVRSSDQGTTFLVRLPTPGAPGPTLNGMGVAAADVDLRSVDTVRPARGGDGRRQPDGAGADRGEAHFGELFALAPDRAPER
jgi:signal transduction histidine kinase